MKVTSWNLLHGAANPGASADGLSPDQLSGQPDPAGAPAPLSPERARELLKQAGASLIADVVGLQEIDRLQPRSGGLHQIELLAQALGGADWAFAPTVIGTPGEKWRPNSQPEHHLETDRSRSSLAEHSYGIGLISKIPVVRWHRIDLGRSIVGLPLAVPTAKGVRPLYVKDEPRVAIAAELENGFTVAVTHLSFVPVVNVYQLRKVQRWMSKMPGEKILIGDLNLPFGIPEKVSSWKSLAQELTYPSWGAKVQFDYILAQRANELEITRLPQIYPGVSDHLPLTVEITKARTQL
jgi:endonuclease/exonuclease/phosphatase family metal-dependent hydrolase